MADDDPTFKPGGSLSFGKLRRKTLSKAEEILPELPTWELQEGYRMLHDLMKVSKWFLEAPDAMEKGMADYFEVIEKPMWFLEMKRKFEEAQYAQLSDFVSDVRLMLLNCYRYFGPHAYHTKRALSVEARLEQKLSLLPVNFQNQCSLEATNGPLENVEEGAEVQSRLLHSVRMERFQREKVRRQKLAEERKAEEQGKDSDVLQWEREVLFQGNAREIMTSMWELPVIGHFIVLGLEHLNIEEIPQFEIERIFLMPQASRSLSIIMTTLLCPPMMRMKLSNKPPMPYKIWTRKLKQKVALWYKMYAKSNNDADLMFEKLGIEHQFWKILGSVNPLEEYEFHELTFHQRVWLVKTVCDYLLQHQKILRDLLSGQPEEFGNCLGMDRLGSKFLYFRQFFGQDVRVYRQAPDPPSWIERDLEYQAEFEAISSLDGLPKIKIVRRKKRRGVVNDKASEDQNSTSNTRKIIKRGWKHGKLKQVKKSSSSSNQSPSSQTQINSDCPPALTNSETGELEEVDSDLAPPVLHRENSSSRNSSPNSVNGDKESNVHNEQCGTNNEIEEKKKCDITNKVDKDNENCDVSDKVEEDTEKINNNVEDKEKLVNNVEVKDKPVNNVEDKDKLVNNVEDKDKCDIMNTNEENKVDSDKCVNGVDAKQNIVDMEKSKTDWTEESIGSVIKIKIEPQIVVEDTTEVEIKVPRKPLYDPHWLRPSPDDFLLVADSVEGIRELLAKYCDDDLDLIQRINNAKTGRGSRPSCEIRLAKRLNELILELEPCELKSITDTKKCRRKLYDEWYAFEIRPEDYVDADETFWLNEKEPVEVAEETPMEETTNGLPLEQEGVVASQGSEGVEEAANETLEIAPEEVADTSLDSIAPTSRQRTLRNRRITVNHFLGLWGDKEEESIGSESDSGNSDLWEMPKKKKKRKPRVSKVISPEDEEICDGAKPKKQQKKKDKTATATATEEVMTSDQNSNSTTAPAAGFEGAYNAWLGDSKKENHKGGTKKRSKSCDNAKSSVATSKAGKHPASAANVRKKLFNENTNPKTLSTPTSTTVSTTVSNTQSLTKVSSSTSIVLKHMAQNFAEPTNPNLSARATPRTSTASATTKTSASKTSAAVEEVVILSDDSDDDIQFVGVHNPPPTKTKAPRTKLILQEYPASTLLQKNIPQLALTSRPATLPTDTQFGVVSQTSPLPRIATVESIASPTATVRYSQQARRSTITCTSSPQHSMPSPTTLKQSTNAVFSTPNKVAQPVVVATIGNSSVLLRSPQPSSPATPQRKQRTQPVLRSPVTTVVLPSPTTFHSPSQTVVHTPPQVMRSPTQVSVRSPVTTVLPVGTEITLRPSPVHSQVQVSSPLQVTRFTPPSGRAATSPTATPANVGNMAQVAGGTRATLVVVPGDGNTASNYALAFSNGTRMILTPEQVAQIRAENNGVLGTGSLSGIFGQ